MDGEWIEEVDWLRASNAIDSPELPFINGVCRPSEQLFQAKHIVRDEDAFTGDVHYWFFTLQEVALNLQIWKTPSSLLEDFEFSLCVAQQNENHWNLFQKGIDTLRGLGAFSVRCCMPSRECGDRFSLIELIGKEGRAFVVFQSDVRDDVVDLAVYLRDINHQDGLAIADSVF